ncbi:MAG TPA: cell division ATP-binding protein FtsE [Gammaproteobacteria bacterium]|nr:cell division ATP-binding protein FtsE [Gammaproteobacteria bacterium]|tara:strand:- start:1172 stop:1855 length:684 start_codon:yes stop_codon:yes gene_type:complete
MSTIELQHVTRRFDNGQEGLSNISAQFDEGSMTFLTGHSGAGKSTFLKLLIGADRPTRGRVLVNGVDIGGLTAQQLPWYRRQVGVVFQDHHLLADRSIYENVAIPLLIRNWHPRDIARRVRGALGRVGLLDKETMLPSYLSTGEQQRVGIARAVVNRPRILLADEPTGNLDPYLSESIMRLFNQFNEIGTTVIIATHDVELIRRLGLRTMHLQEGKVVDDMPAANGL